MKILIAVTVLVLLSACTPSLTTTGETVTIISGTKCPATPPTGTCPVGIPNNIDAFIEVNANGAPESVNDIDSCAGKKVTWTYKDNYPAGDAPPFLIIFDPDVYPGNSYKVLSKSVDQGKNQEFTLNTRAVKSPDANECLNYDVMIPGKGLLDPVFIIKR